MFDGLASRYDMFNRLTSLGMDKSWRNKVLEPLSEGIRVLDLGCGTGDLCLEVARRSKGKSEAVGLDFSASMLRVAQKRYEALGFPANGHFRLLQKSAEELPLDEPPFHLIVSGFVLRNLYQNIDKILEGVHASLKEGGEIRFLDFTEPPQKWLLGLWRFYMNTAAEFYGRILFGKKFPSQYLLQSAERFPKPDQFVEKLRRHGFERIQVKRFLLGIIVLYRAQKPGGGGR